MSKAVIYGASGQHEIEVTEKIYEQAHDAKCSVPQYLQREFGKDVNANEHGTVFAQLLAQSNMSLNGDQKTGLGATVLGQALSGNIMAATTRDAIPLSRILTPAALLELVEVKRAADRSSDIDLFKKMLAVDTSIGGSRFEQPVFDASSADTQEVSRIGQLQVPNLVGKLTVSERAGAIPTYSYGLEISDEAKKAMTFDQVAVYLARMADSQAAARLDNNINMLINGNVDMSQKALSKVKANTFDGAAAGKLTHKAYLKWLRAERRKRTIDWVLCDLETYYKIVERDGRPTATTVKVDDAEINAFATRPANLQFVEPQIFVVNDGVIAANTLVGIDSRYAIARIRNTEADYRAVEELVMRKGEQMRFDEGEVVYRLDDSAWSVLDLTA